ncbi:MAG TPA: chaperone modulator CbpM [Desulfobacteraceae bacterium]|jgi:MerR family transcriptional regulator/heat shock protein HspR|nr:chaperone modulator CbpM [Desulfobacteraceae bacterium]HPJ67766.1 chaperone modulator CbpM [Desulfobacteraceae bacterium]HPQ28836.1 chaperone modulator CbpM [Desulfobacteraceae bacterium]
MVKKFWTIAEVIEIFQVDKSLLYELEEEEIICPVCRGRSRDKFFPPGELEKLRFAKILIEDMGVNLAGVEVILRMKQNMVEMRKQFDSILEEMARDIRKRLNNEE